MQTERQPATPDAWPELLAYVEPYAPNTLQAITGKTAQRVFDRIDWLDHAALETNYYFGLEAILRGVTRQLQQEPSRRRAISHSAEALVIGAMLSRPNTMPLMEPFRPTLGDVSSNRFMAQPFLDMALQTLRESPPALRTLADGLSQVVRYRRLPAMGKRTVPIITRRQHARRIPAGLSAQRIAMESFSGPTTALAAALGRNPLTDAMGNLDKPLSPAALATARESKDLLPQARLRLDELRIGHGWIFDGDRLHFDTAVLRQPPLPLPPKKASHRLHEARLGCPALRSGLANDVVRNILPEALLASRSLVPAIVVITWQKRYPNLIPVMIKLWQQAGPSPDA